MDHGMILSVKSCPKFIYQIMKNSPRQVSSENSSVKSFGKLLKESTNLQENKGDNQPESKIFLQIQNSNLNIKNQKNQKQKKSFYFGIKHLKFYQKKQLNKNNQQIKSKLKFSFSKKTKWTLQDFEIHKQLGKGSYGNVLLAQEKKTNFLCAIKVISKNMIKTKNMEEYVFREIKIGSFVDHPNIAKVYGAFADSQKIYLIMEYMKDGTLYELLKSKKYLSQQETSAHIRSICQGVKYLHKNNIIHRDLKLQNILLSNNFTKLGDLGCSVQSLSLRQTQIGSLEYLSPQQIRQEQYGKKSDIWCIGILTYELLFGKSPFHDDIAEMLKNNSPKKYSDLKFPFQISNQAQDFLEKILDKDASKRMQLRQALNHPFLKLQDQI